MVVWSWKRAALCAVLATLVACGGEDESVGSEEQNTKALTFDRNLVLSDEALTDAEGLSLSEVQAFLEATPHKKRSALADITSNGRTAAEAFVDAGKKYGINPLVLMTRIQLEQGIISKTSIKQNQLDWAMGCGCPDGRDCYEQFRGFDKQIECAAERLRTYLDEIDEKGTSIAGWGVGVTKRTLDNQSITPRNQATAAIYTYTPWASSAKNHASIWRKYADATGYIAKAPGGCDVAEFPSGMRVQLRPSALVDQYDRNPCFLDTWQLVDPYEHTVWDVSAKVSDNFKMSEYASRSKTTEILLHTALVDTVQAVRSKLVRGVSIKQAYMTPEEHASSCGADCDATVELTRGLGVVISSSSGNAAVMDAAAAVGVPTCFSYGDGVFVGIGNDEQGCPR